MPRSKRKQKYEHSKQHHVEDDDGWTHVVRGPSMKTANSNGKAGASKRREELLRPRPLEDLDACMELYHKIKQELREHPSILAFRKAFDERLSSHPSVEISHVVCLGLGNPSQNYGGGREWLSMKQLILLEHAIEVLQGRSRIAQPLRVYFQDPAFTELSMSFLSSRGYQVIPFCKPELENAMSSLESVNTESQLSDSGQTLQIEMTSSLQCTEYLKDSYLLFGPHLEHELALDAVLTKVPSVWIGNDFDSFDPATGSQQTPRNDPKTGLKSSESKHFESKFLARDALHEQLDWIKAEVVFGSDTNYWCNNMTFAMSKVPNAR